LAPKRKIFSATSHRLQTLKQKIQFVPNPIKVIVRIAEDYLNGEPCGHAFERGAKIGFVSK
jgi:hypothetical protein